MLSKLLGLLSVGSTMASVGLLNRFLSGIATIVVLAIVSAFMLCTLLASVFYAGYLGLASYGLEPYVAALIIGMIALALTVGLITTTALKLRELRDIPRSMPQKSSSPPDIANIAHAFIDGFINPR